MTEVIWLFLLVWPPLVLGAEELRKAVVLGGVEGAMSGAFVGFGVDGGLAWRRSSPTGRASTGCRSSPA
jgi:hypothetical protein